jgi:hypothetical protein
MNGPRTNLGRKLTVHTVALGVFEKDKFYLRSVLKDLDIT